MLSTAWGNGSLDGAPDQGGLGRSPTFVVGSAKQRGILEEFQKRDQQLSEQMIKNKRLCFNGGTFQRTHPRKAQLGHSDADAALISPICIGVADGVSQIEEFGIDASELPRELLKACEDLAMSKLIPDQIVSPQDKYFGPISLMAEAYESTESMGSTTALLAILDNTTKVHGKLHPMIAMISIGDCELIILRRIEGRKNPMEAIFHTEMQRIDGNAQAPLQIARLDDTVDPAFDESLAIEVIRHGSAVHCVSAYEGDILVLGSDGVFDNMFVDEIADIVNDAFPPRDARPYEPAEPELLEAVARRIVESSHAKTKIDATGQYPMAPIGRGGKVDDTCCVIGEVIAWTEAHSEAAALARRARQWHSVTTCGGKCNRERRNFDDDSWEADEEDDARCSIT